jgi:thiosulfate/3-mercaptopyruvate sulfurtransferase
MKVNIRPSGSILLSCRRHLLFALGLMTVCLPAYARDEKAASRPVTDVAVLKSRIDTEESKPVLVDVRDEKAYRNGHIPGAINLPVELTFNQRGDHTRIASLQRIRHLASNAGIHNSDELVLYDDGDLRNAAHEYWVLETYGHQRISVLNGGLAAWKQEHGRLSTEDVKRPKSNYLPTISTHRLSTELATLLALRNPHVKIIDARSSDEYLGKFSRAERKGHIPGAISIPWYENLTRTSKVPLIKPKPALKSLYAGLKPDDHVIAYCNRGKESAVTYLILRQLGYRVSVYDGAWLEWGNDEHVPVESGTRDQGGSGHGR